jgi:hypothetical protein
MQDYKEVSMEQLYNKHYIRLDANNCITKGFTDAFENPIETDICISEEGGRHFELNGVTNPPLTDMQGVHFYKYINENVVETTEAERQAEFDTFTIVDEADPVAEYMIDLDYRLSLLELGV